MATKARRATLKDIYAGATIYSVYLGSENLDMETHYIMSRPRSNWTKWADERRYFWNGHEPQVSQFSLADAGIHPRVYTHRIAFTTRKAAERFVREFKGTGEHTRHVRQARIHKAECDRMYTYDDYEDPTPDEYDAIARREVERLLPEFLKAREQNPEYIWQRSVNKDKLYAEWPTFVVPVEDHYLVVSKVEKNQYRIDAYFKLEDNKAIAVESRNDHVVQEGNKFFLQAGWSEHQPKYLYHDISLGYFVGES